VDGVLVIDKPEGWTSHDVVAKVRRLSKTKKVGHLGTLDPIATGVLPLVLGRATRLAQFFVKNEKVYEGVIRFGYSTTTYDREGEPTSEDKHPVLDRAVLETLAAQFRGTIMQPPPPVSAKKVGGVPAYKLARKNEPVDLAPVEVHIYNFQILGIDNHRDVRVWVHCSGGTYLRSIAHEMGKALGCGAFLQQLRRTASGDFRIEDARTLEKVADLAADERLFDAVLPVTELLPEFPEETVDPVTANQIRQGRDFRVSPFRAQTDQRYVKAITEDGQFIAIGEARMPHLYHPILVL
jgi:tRNA pseudouridine55 synthase